jgi:hypothetical protein
MPVLKNPRWEAFCQQVIRSTCGDKSVSFTQSEAYQRAGFKAKGEGARVNAHRLMRLQESVVARIEELRAEFAKETKETLEGIVAELNDTATEAKADRAHSARTSAISTKARLLGLEVQRVEQGNPGDFTQARTTKDMAKAELVALGVANPDDHQVTMAVEALRRYAASLEAIASQQAQPEAAILTTATDLPAARH